MMLAPVFLLLLFHISCSQGPKRLASVPFIFQGGFSFAPSTLWGGDPFILRGGFSYSLSSHCGGLESLSSAAFGDFWGLFPAIFGDVS